MCTVSTTFHISFLVCYFINLCVGEFCCLINVSLLICMGYLTASAKGKEKKWRQADTNVVAVRFDQLTNPSNMHTGDAVSCQRCHAIMSHISTIKDAENDQKVTVVTYRYYYYYCYYYYY